MESFRTELENPVVQKDIIDLEKKIRLFKEGKIDPEKFRSLRLARGVYGQRQPGVQMIRIKIPFGKLTTKQLIRIAQVADDYSNGNLHLTTRQDVQIHFVSLDRTPELWAELERDDITLREACGNTVRNITASAEAGIDPEEPFDVSPYAHAMFSYFLRKPFCQELGRKIKIAFSSNAHDSAYTFIHDLGFIPQIRTEHGQTFYGFKVVIAGGLGAQPILAQTAFEFLPATEIIPFTEAVLRVFDRHGERTNRHKARLKYLVSKIGLQVFLDLVEQEKKAVSFKNADVQPYENSPIEDKPIVDATIPSELLQSYLHWVSTNVIQQKQDDYVGVYIKVPIGNISSDNARKLAVLVELYAANDIRVTNNQSLLLKYIRKENLKALYLELYSLGLAHAGAQSTGDITACPGTDTCNLAIAGSTALSIALENVIKREYSDYLSDNQIKIKISGCMNSCGQHGLAHIGFHGSSIKVGEHVVPAVQVLLAGGALGNGNGRVAEKIIKVPTKRSLNVLRLLLSDYDANKHKTETFHSYFDRKGKMYFYQLLKPLADTHSLTPDEYQDWGAEQKFETAIGIGECAGVTIDLVQTLLLEANEKSILAQEALALSRWGDAVYHAYASILHGAKALLISNGIECNTQVGILNDFEKEFGHENRFRGWGNLKEFVLEINKHEATEKFAQSYVATSQVWLSAFNDYREDKIKNNKEKLEHVKFDL